MNIPVFVLAFAGIEALMWAALWRSRWYEPGAGGHFAALVIAALIAVLWAQAEVSNG